MKKKNPEVTSADIARMNVEAACRYQTGDLRVSPKLLADFQRMAEFASVMPRELVAILFPDLEYDPHLAGRYRGRNVYLEDDSVGELIEMEE
jgi:hypothetical protein